MKESEILHIIIAIIVLSIVISITDILQQNPNAIGLSILFAVIVILVNVAAKKAVAYSLDAGVEHKIWTFSRFGLRPGMKFEKEIPLGAILPLVLSIFSLGIVKCMTLLTYETQALKRRAAKRFGIYSFTEMTEWHNALVGAAGIVALLILSFISYWIPAIAGLTPVAIYYCFWNMLPFSKLDGSQIYFGSRVLWTLLATLTAIGTAYALIL